MDAWRGSLLEKERRQDERIVSAINKGKQTLLPRYTMDINLSKFEHNGKGGPLVVFTEELSYRFGNFDNYKAVKKYFKPSVKIHTDNVRSTKTLKTKLTKLKDKNRGLMLDGKPGGGNLSHNLTTSNVEYGISDQHSFHKELKLPKLKSGSMKQDGDSKNASSEKFEFTGDSSSGLEYSKNTELPKLPAQEYIDNFRRNAAEFERNLRSIGRAPTDRRPPKGKMRENVLPKIDEKVSLLSSNTNKFLTRDDHFRLPKLHHKKEVQDGQETVNKKKRKAKNIEQKRTTHQDHGQLRRSTMSHSERKAAAQKEQAKWCKMTFQSNAYI